VDHEVVVMPANLELIIMVGIFNCLTILIMLFSCWTVPGELMPMHMLVVVLLTLMQAHMPLSGEEGTIMLLLLQQQPL
jgi:hypothetical protein